MKNQKGITLIALIITILVMLILAAVTINLVMDEDGILSKAQSATSKMSMAEVKERAELVAMDVKTDLKIGETVMGVKATCMQKLAETFGVSLEDEEVKNGNKLTVAGGKYDIIVKNSNLDIEVRENSEIVEKDELIKIKFTDTPIELDGLRQVDITVSARAVMDDESYKSMRQNQEKEELKDDATLEEKKIVVWKAISEENTGDLNKIKSVDDYCLWIINSLGVGPYDKLDDCLDDDKVLKEFGKTEGSVTKGQIYNALINDETSDAEATEGEVYYWILNRETGDSMEEEEFINEVYSFIKAAEEEKDANEKLESYATEYEEYTKNLTMNIKGIDNNLQSTFSLADEFVEIGKFSIVKNGKYEIELINSNGKVVSSEIIQINNIAITLNSSFVPADENSPWRTDGNGEIIEYIGDGKDIIVPMYIGSEKVTSIRHQTFLNCTTVEKITIPDTVTSIGHTAFRGCSSLKEIIIPDTVEFNTYWAFMDCTSLKEVKLPSKTTIIEDHMFSGCTSLEKVIIPNTVTTLGRYMFSGCSSLKEIIIPESVTVIPDQAFTNANGLKEIVIPNSVTSLGTSFENCIALESVTLSNQLTEIKNETFWGCTSLRDITIPISVTKIGGSVFRNCSSLTGIVIPDSVISIGSCIFQGCSSLENVTLSNKIDKIPSCAFVNCSSLTKITIPKSVTSINSSSLGGALPSFQGCDSLKNIYLEAGSSLTIPTEKPWGATNATVTVLPAQ